MPFQTKTGSFSSSSDTLFKLRLVVVNLPSGKNVVVLIKGMLGNRSEHKKLWSAVVLISVAVSLMTCKKNALGGSSTIKGVVMHHSAFIPYSRVYIKFNAKDLPSLDTNAYDSHVSADASGNYSFKCYKGDYFLFGYGFDHSINLPVKGGVAVHIRNDETVNTTVPVTE